MFKSNSVQVDAFNDFVLKIEKEVNKVEAMLFALKDAVRRQTALSFPRWHSWVIGHPGC
jgi:hypothetical protein